MNKFENQFSKDQMMDLNVGETKFTFIVCHVGKLSPIELEQTINRSAKYAILHTATYISIAKATEIQRYFHYFE